MNTLTHYANATRTLDRSIIYHQEVRASFTAKPRGLWVSVDGEDDWYQWCDREDYYPDGLRCAHRVTLADDANVLWIDNLRSFTEFHDTYAVPDRDRLGALMLPGGQMHYEAIDWPTVTTKYQGLIIAPYLWPFRLSHMWYYGWDCASGCIWGLDAIAGFEPIPEHTRRFRELDINDCPDCGEEEA